MEAITYKVIHCISVSVFVAGTGRERRDLIV